jgi:hypothetical protein
MEVPVQNKLNTYGLNKPQLAALIVAFLLCVWALWSGISSGLSRERSLQVYSNSRSVLSALKYYHADQEIYPTADQFFNREIMVPFYLSAMPVYPKQKGDCASFSNFQYSQSSPNSFSLKYCLESNTEGESAGVHQLTEKDIK